MLRMTGKQRREGVYECGTFSIASWLALQIPGGRSSMGNCCHLCRKRWVAAAHLGSMAERKRRGAPVYSGVLRGIALCDAFCYVLCQAAAACEMEVDVN